MDQDQINRWARAVLSYQLEKTRLAVWPGREQLLKYSKARAEMIRAGFRCLRSPEESQRVREDIAKCGLSKYFNRKTNGSR